MSEVAAIALWYPVFLFATTFHEAAHAWVAKRGGDLTAYEGGQVSLNPIPHIRREPIGMVLVPVLSLLLGGFMFGWASTPFDPMWAARYPKRAAVMSAAGPIANLILVLFAAMVIRIGILAGWFLPTPIVNYSALVAPSAPGFQLLAAVLSVMFSLNLLLFVFNLIPLPPLDGGGVLGLFLAEDTHRRFVMATSQPWVGLVALVLIWNFFGYLFAPIYRVALSLLL